MADWGNISSRGKVVDRRGFAPAAIGGISLSGLALLMFLNFLSGGDVGDVLNNFEQQPTRQEYSQNQGEFEGEDSYELFASTVLGSNNEMWRQIFSHENLEYNEPTLVLFRGRTQSSCGGASAEVGPHYCPIDETIYLDETFFEELSSRFGAQGGDVAEAYVIAHEVGHHVQHQLNLIENERTNDESIKTELQADCFAGLWASSIEDRKVINPGEIREAMDAAAAVGDDRIQERVTGRVNPENWTHGSSDQRVDAFSTGYRSQDFNACI